MQALKTLRDLGYEPQQFIDDVEDYFEFPRGGLKKKNRIMQIRSVRQMCIYLLHYGYKLTEYELQELFERDHSTINSSKKVVRNLLETRDNYYTNIYNHFNEFISMKIAEYSLKKELI